MSHETQVIRFAKWGFYVLAMVALALARNEAQFLVAIFSLLTAQFLQREEKP